MRLALLFQHAADLGLDVEWADLGTSAAGSTSATSDSWS